MATQKITEIAQVVRVLGVADVYAEDGTPMQLTPATIGQYLKDTYFKQGYSLFNTHVINTEKGFPTILYVLTREVDAAL